MKSKALIRISTALCAFLLIFTAGCTKKGQNAKDNYVMEKTPEELYGYEYIVNSAEYAYAFATNDDSHKILVNKTHPLEISFVPNELATLDSALTTGGKTVQMESVAADAAKALITEMRTRGYTGISVTSGYRSYSYQDALFNKYIEDEMEKNSSLSRDAAKAKVLTYSAKPGTSEHQTGLCMDLFYDGMIDLVNYGYETEKNKDDIGFAETGAFRWLCENARYFGFILRFPKDKDSITGYSYESWHFRFVGVETAIQIAERNITFEEYIGQ